MVLTHGIESTSGFIESECYKRSSVELVGTSDHECVISLGCV